MRRLSERRIALLLLMSVNIQAASSRIESFQFKEPAPREHQLLIPEGADGEAMPVPWLKVVPTNAGGGLPKHEFGSQIVLGLHPGGRLSDLGLKTQAVRVRRHIPPLTWVLDAADAHAAARLAEQLAERPEVRLCHPDQRFERRSSSTYAPQPNDEKYWNLWHLEARNPDGSSAGADINAREAWAISRGEAS
jgi:hypothetical protein